MVSVALADLLQYTRMYAVDLGRTNRSDAALPPLVDQIQPYPLSFLVGHYPTPISRVGWTWLIPPPHYTPQPHLLHFLEDHT